MPITEVEKIWMDGELVDWADAKIHVLSHAVHYGSGVFEGIRAYDTPRGTAVFRLRDHMQRLHDSARLLYMDIPYGVDELRERIAAIVVAGEGGDRLARSGVDDSRSDQPHRSQRR